jgi:hypothetical protein
MQPRSHESSAGGELCWLGPIPGGDAGAGRAGGISDGAPGLRNYHPGYYAAFLLDPEGNKVEAVFHHGER